MMGLLARLETHPESTDILNVPVSYVMRVMFKHGQQSLLSVREENGKPVGSIALHPSITAPDGRALRFSGAFSARWPEAARQRINFNGTIDMDKALRVLAFHGDVTMQHPGFHLAVAGDTVRNFLAYEADPGNAQGSAWQTLPLDGAAIEPALLRSVGINPGALPISMPNVSPPDVTAREAQISLNGEQLEVYQVTIREGTATIADIYISQMGQIVQAKTNFGYVLSAEGYQ